MRGDKLFPETASLRLRRGYSLPAENRRIQIITQGRTSGRRDSWDWETFERERPVDWLDLFGRMALAGQDSDDGSRLYGGTTVKSKEANQNCSSSLFPIP